jgi:hypothetical protein
MKKIWKQFFGLLQLIFAIQLAIVFIMFIALLIHKDDLTKKDTKHEEKIFLRVTLIACCSLIPTTFLIVYLIVQRSLTIDLVGSFRILQVGASLKVAMLSWVINVIVAILDFIGILHCKGKSGTAQWQLVLVYYSLFITQQAYQSKY